MKYKKLEKLIDIDTESFPLWVFIRDNYEKIILAKESGITYKRMAESAGVSQLNFSIALKKAKKNIEEKSNIGVKEEVKDIEKDIIKEKTKLPPELPPELSRKKISSFSEV